MRSDAEVYLTFDVTRSMLARSSPTGIDRLDRSRALGLEIHDGLLDFPTGVATLTNRMMPLLFPTGDARGVTAVLNRSLRILQPQPARLTAARATQVGVLTLAADRSYFNPQAKRRALVVFTDLDSDYFSLTGTLQLLRDHDIEPFVVRVAKPGGGRVQPRRSAVDLPAEQHRCGELAPERGLACLRGDGGAARRLGDPRVSRRRADGHEWRRRVPAEPRACISRSPCSRSQRCSCSRRSGSSFAPEPRPELRRPVERLLQC